MTFTSTAQTGRIGGTRFLGEWLHSVRDYGRKTALYARTFKELDRLSDRELADIGIHRAEIRRIASDAAFGA